MLDRLQPVAPFLGAQFWPFEPSHVRRIAPLLRQWPHRLSGYTAACLVAWNRTFEYQWTLCGSGALLISCVMPPSRERHLLQPVGVLPAGAWARLVAAARDLPYPLRLWGVDRSFVEANPEVTRWFDVEHDRDNDNYLYRSADLAALHGHRFAKKRNLITQASKSYAWSAQPLAADQVAACFEVMGELRHEEGEPLAESLRQDDEALRRLLESFVELEQEGVLIRVEGRPAAFSLFEPQGPDVAVVHFERALRRHKGLHQVVNRAVAQAVVDCGFSFINREEDLGDAGLRQAKESYFPVRLEEALTLTLRREPSE